MLPQLIMAEPGRSLPVLPCHMVSHILSLVLQMDGPLCRAYGAPLRESSALTVAHLLRSVGATLISWPLHGQRLLSLRTLFRGRFLAFPSHQAMRFSIEHSIGSVHLSPDSLQAHCIPGGFGAHPPSIVCSDGPALLNSAGRRRRFYAAVRVEDAPGREAVLSLGICPFRPGDGVADPRFGSPSTLDDLPACCSIFAEDPWLRQAGVRYGYSAGALSSCPDRVPGWYRVWKKGDVAGIAVEPAGSVSFFLNGNHVASTQHVVVPPELEYQLVVQLVHSFPRTWHAPLPSPALRAFAVALLPQVQDPRWKWLTSAFRAWSGQQVIIQASIWNGNHLLKWMIVRAWNNLVAADFDVWLDIANCAPVLDQPPRASRMERMSSHERATPFPSGLHGRKLRTTDARVKQKPKPVRSRSKEKSKPVRSRNKENHWLARWALNEGDDPLYSECPQRYLVSL